MTGPASDSNAPAPPTPALARNSRRETPSSWLSVTAAASCRACCRTFQLKVRDRSYPSRRPKRRVGWIFMFAQQKAVTYRAAGFPCRSRLNPHGIETHWYAGIQLRQEPLKPDVGRRRLARRVHIAASTPLRRSDCGALLALQI